MVETQLLLLVLAGAVLGEMVTTMVEQEVMLQRIEGQVAVAVGGLILVVEVVVVMAVQV